MYIQFFCAPRHSNIKSSSSGLNKCYLNFSLLLINLVHSLYAAILVHTGGCVNDR